MHSHNLVDMRKVNPNIQFDIVYATPNNFTGKTLYPVPACYLHKDAAEAIDKIQKDLEKNGLGLKIFDGYRPLHVQQFMWDLIQDDRYVANPAIYKGRHTRGVAVDVTIVDKEGKELEMPTPFDTFSELGHSTYMDLPPHIMKNRTLLFEHMGKHGFTPLPTEWWHFDFKGWQDDVKYPALDVPLDFLK